MEYKKGFIHFKHTGYGWVTVTNAGWHVGKFRIAEGDLSSQNRFNVVCMDFMHHPEFENLLRIGEVRS